MSTSQMINFRATPDEKRAIDHAAKIAGMSRSDWIKAQIKKGLGITATPTAPLAPVQTNQPVCIINTPGPACKAAKWVKIAGGDKHCQTCGLTRT